MIESAVDEPRVKRMAYTACAAGATGVLANLFLIILYVDLGLKAGRPEGGTFLGPVGEIAGSANDLLGSLAAAFMIPVALFLTRLLPRRRITRFVQAAGLIVIVLLTITRCSLSMSLCGCAPKLSQGTRSHVDHRPTVLFSTARAASILARL